MGNYIQNTNISCTYCGYSPIQGIETANKDKRGNLLVECKWTCSRCGMLVRRDEKTIPAEQPKEDTKTKK
jgi:DNA-directed RNA polymerase subunit RPC12/RpoP